MTPAGTRTGFAAACADACADACTVARAAVWGTDLAVVAGAPFAAQAVRSAVSTTATAVDAVLGTGVGAAVLDRVTRP
ncbi:hypothetical protein GCM10023074_47430 [Microbispora amethystogenes]|uniref:Uncharacterized protein n=1 Tax=Microbispora amethystogenes TaxID=1427754 RepID=A0ABQ4FG12_9ACTN|nr:hypothetical protein Mam01_39340 [Microbispora amethystogenes]